MKYTEGLVSTWWMTISVCLNILCVYLWGHLQHFLAPSLFIGGDSLDSTWYWGLLYNDLKLVHVQDRIFLIGNEWRGMVFTLAPITKACFNFVFGLFIASIEVLLIFAYSELIWILQLWCANLLFLLIMYSLGFSIHKIISSANRDHFTSFQIWIAFILLHCLIV